jgi:hypothetical protein
MPIDPAAALAGAIAAPFAARLLVAWSVEMRLRGFIYGANLEPRRRRSDYPTPNDPIRSLVVYLLASAIGWAFATLVSTQFKAPALIATFAVSAAISFEFALLRIRADDRRMRDVLAARLGNRALIRAAGEAD